MSVLDKSFEGILWLKLVHKLDKQVFLPCVCYLPPENSSRQFDVNEFYEHLLVNMYQYQKEGLIYICGDFNSRCGELDDFIAGVDHVTQRQVIDYTTNYYGELFVDFLINTNTVMLNGRFNECDNNFTSVSVKGLSVVDYCITRQDHLSKFSDFKVLSTSEIMNRNDAVGVYAPSCIPDHSLLSWKINLKITDPDNVDTTRKDNCKSYDKFDLKDVKSDFMNSPSVIDEINRLISRLEQNEVNVTNIDGVYTQWCEMVRHCMYDEIPYKTLRQESNSHKHKVNKPWWNTDLSTSWEKMCQAEKKWLKCKSRTDKILCKAEYVKLRKLFDQNVQRSKRKYWFSLQNDLLHECDTNPNEFWKSMGKIGVGYSDKKTIPEEVVLLNGDSSAEISEVLKKWKNDFSSLFNRAPEMATEREHSVDSLCSANAASENLELNQCISILEVKKAIFQAKNGKAHGFDEIPAEVLKNDTAVYFLHVLFNLCFENGIVPTIWGKTIINPIPKSSALDPRDPMSYRGISLASAVYKVYCRIINNRLGSWVEGKNLLVEEQNGFRKHRSTIDQIASLTDIVETRKKSKLSTFAAFIDFRKAYDTVNRDKLWDRLKAINISGKLLLAIQSLYKGVSSCVKLNKHTTEWFDVKCGLRQGCVLSPLLFNLFINDLALYLKSLDVGIDIGDEKVCILMYADDVVLLARSEDELQVLLNALHDWCTVNAMSINVSKSNVVHFRTDSTTRTIFTFKCGDQVIECSSTYRYLGLVLDEHLNLNTTAKMVAQSASRALGLVIAKCKIAGGVPYNVFTKLYDAIVWPVIAYGAAIWGHREYSCISSVQNRAMRYFLGVGKYTPSAAVLGEMGWIPCQVRQWKVVVSFWSRLSCTTSTRVNKRIALWAFSKANQCKNWYFCVQNMLRKLRLHNVSDISNPISKLHIVRTVQEKLMANFVNDWLLKVQSPVGPSRCGLNKLRTYCKFKTEFKVENYCTIILPRTHRAAFSKFRCGVAPIRLETGRYEGLPVDRRLCQFCGVIENESHVLLYCKLYTDIRNRLFSKASATCPNFLASNDLEKLIIIFTEPTLIRLSAKTCFEILQRRQFFKSR